MRTRKARWLIPTAIVAALLLLPWLGNDETEALGDRVRASAPGAFVRLSEGFTHYELAGPETGQPVILVHGTTVPSFLWDPNFDVLARQGFRVLRYDLYGRGLSDRPHARYDIELHLRQLEELYAELTPATMVDLVGLSMGGIVIAEFARRHPDRVRRLVLIDPAGVGTDLPLSARLAVAPAVGEYIMRAVGTSQLRPSRRMLLHPERFPGIDDLYLPTIRFEGSRRAVLESLRHMPYNDYDDGYRALGDLDKPVLLVWGVHDAVVPFAASERVRELVRPTRFLAVEGAGHLSNYEQPEVVNRALLDFLADVGE